MLRAQHTSSHLVPTAQQGSYCLHFVHEETRAFFITMQCLLISTWALTGYILIGELLRLWREAISLPVKRWSWYLPFLFQMQYGTVEKALDLESHKI